MSQGHRILLKCARWVHVYLTMFGLLLILFFAGTGFMLNHEDWFDLDSTTTSTSRGAMPTRFLNPVDKFEIVEWLRREQGVRGGVNTFDDKDADEVRVVFKAPAREHIAVIQRKTGEVEVTHETRGILNVLTDLHKGKEVGMLWKLLIDGVCVMLFIVSLTGLILWQSLRGRAQYGLVFVALGAMVGVGAFYWSVP